MQWLITGSHGMLGTDVARVVADAGEQVRGVGRGELDITDAGAIAAALDGVDVVVNCAAYTDVDGAEEHEETATEVNGLGPTLLAQACSATGRAWLVQPSTDYVFAGTASTPYQEGSPLLPINAYGRSKALGETGVRQWLPTRHLILRTAWLYGAHGACFPKTIARLARERERLSVVADQVGQPTWTRDVGELILRLVRAQAPCGTYHATSAGQTSWFEFARAVVASAGLDPGIVTPTDSGAVPRPAARPAYSVLGHAAFETAAFETAAFETAGSETRKVEPIGDWAERWAAAADEVIA